MKSIDLNCTNNNEPDFNRFDALEINAIHRDVNGNCEPVHDAGTRVSFYSLYGHIPGQGLECLHDFGESVSANKAYRKTRRIAKQYSLPIVFG